MPQTAKQKKKVQRAKKEQAWLASELLQGEELARPTTAPVSRMLRDGFVLDMNPEDQLAVIEGNDTEDFLSKSRLLAARISSRLPAFERLVQEQELRAHLLPFELAMDNRRAKQLGDGGSIEELQERNVALASEYAALHAAAEERAGRFARMEQTGGEWHNEIQGGAIAGRYHDARLHSMTMMHDGIEAAADHEDQHSATLGFMAARYVQELREKHGQAEALKKQREQMNCEMERLSEARRKMDELDLRMSQSLGRFKAFYELEKQGRSRQLDARRDLSAMRQHETKQLRHKVSVEKRRAEDAAIEQVRLATYGKQTVDVIKIAVREAGASAGDRAYRTLASRLGIAPQELLGQFKRLLREIETERQRVATAEARQRHSQGELAKAKLERDALYAEDKGAPVAPPAAKPGAASEAQVRAEQKVRVAETRCEDCRLQAEEASRLLRMVSYSCCGLLERLPVNVSIPINTRERGAAQTRLYAAATKKDKGSDDVLGTMLAAGDEGGQAAPAFATSVEAPSWTIAASVDAGGGLSATGPSLDTAFACEAAVSVRARDGSGSSGSSGSSQKAAVSVRATPSWAPASAAGAAAAAARGIRAAAEAAEAELEAAAETAESAEADAAAREEAVEEAEEAKEDSDGEADDNDDGVGASRSRRPGGTKSKMVLEAAEALLSLRRLANSLGRFEYFFDKGIAHAARAARAAPQRRMAPAPPVRSFSLMTLGAGPTACAATASAAAAQLTAPATAPSKLRAAFAAASPAPLFRPSSAGGLGAARFTALLANPVGADRVSPAHSLARSKPRPSVPGGSGLSPTPSPRPAVMADLPVDAWLKDPRFKHNCRIALSREGESANWCAGVREPMVEAHYREAAETEPSGAMFDDGVRASHYVNPQHANDLYSDDINFHHFTKFKVSPVVHEKRGIVGFSKIRQRHASHEGTWWQQQLNEKTTKSRTAVVIQATALSEAPGGGGAGWHSPPSPQLVTAPAGKS
jgi:hypothetical protein